MAWGEHVRALKQAEKEEAEKVISEGSRVEFAGVPCLVLFAHPKRYTLRLLEPVPRTIAHKIHRFGDDWRVDGSPAELESGLPEAVVPVVPVLIPTTVTEEKPQPVQEALHIPRINLLDFDEPDSYKRQLNALLVYARRIKRVPSFGEALKFIRENDLYTGSWRENESRRKSRVRYILKYISRTFDSSKCNQGQVEVEKYRTWAKQAFPERIPLYTTSIDDLFQCHSYKRGYVNHEDIAVYLAIFEFSLEKGQSLQDRGVPHVRVFGLWKKLYQTGRVRP